MLSPQRMVPVSWLLRLIILMPPALPVSDLLSWRPRYRAVRSHWYFLVSAHDNYILVINWQRGWKPANTEETNWMIPKSKSKVAFVSWHLRHQPASFSFFFFFSRNYGWLLAQALIHLHPFSFSFFFHFTFCHILWLLSLHHFVLVTGILQL